MTLNAAEIAEASIRHGLIGCNIHYHEGDGTWSVWTRHRDRDGWSMSGKDEDLAVALSQAFGDEIATISLDQEAMDLI